MKRALMVLAVVGLAASLEAQSLVELAKREKERREGLRGRHAVVIRNRDLLLVRKAPAVEVTNVGAAAGEDRLETEPGTGETAIPEDAGLVMPPAGPEAADEPAPAGDNAAEDIPEGSGPLEDQLKVADELVESLTAEMNSLRQQYEAQNNMVPGYVIQQQMEETNQRLTRALNRQAEIREKLGSKAPAIKKDPGSAGR